MRTILSIICICLTLIIAMPPDFAHAWYSGSYQYCRKLTMTAGGGSGGVATTTTGGFALVATSTISTLAATSSSGRIYETSTASGTTTPVDIAITSGTHCNNDTGTLRDFYFEQYVPTTGEFVLWVEAGDISSTTQKTVLMYYGYPDNSATDVANENGVFGALSEVGVWNLHEDPGAVGASGTLDSTSNNHGTDNGTMTAADNVRGMVDGAYEFDGTDDYVSAGTTNIPVRAPVTVSVWVKSNSFSAASKPLSKWNDTGTFHAWVVEISTAGIPTFLSKQAGASIGISQVISSVTTVTGRWYHLVGVMDASDNITMYVNTVSSTGGHLYSNAAAPDANVYIGAGQSGAGGNGFYNGTVDDVRIYNRALHSMDALTMYNNTRSSTIFWTFGSEETQNPVAQLGSPRYLRLGTLILMRGTLIIN